MNRRGGSHHHFFVEGFIPAAAAAAAAAAALRFSAATFLALASYPGGLCGVALANVAPAAALLAACKLTSSVMSTNGWRSSSSALETAVGRWRQKRSWASSANTRSESELACPPLVRRRKPSRVRAASSVAVWVRQPARMRATAAACSAGRGGPAYSASRASPIAALAQLTKKA
jgi:hypothetical protein